MALWLDPSQLDPSHGHSAPASDWSGTSCGLRIIVWDGLQHLYIFTTQRFTCHSALGLSLLSNASLPIIHSSSDVKAGDALQLLQELSSTWLPRLFLFSVYLDHLSSHLRNKDVR